MLDAHAGEGQHVARAVHDLRQLAALRVDQQLAAVAKRERKAGSEHRVQRAVGRLPVAQVGAVAETRVGQDCRATVSVLFTP